MKKAYCPFILFIFIGFQFVAAQARFDRVDTITVREGSNTLMNPWAGGINYPLVSEIDLNGDGLQDLFVFDMHNNRIIPFLNDGSGGVNAWHYSPSYIPKFPHINKWALLYDYNCDGKKDLFTLSTSPPSGIAVYRNDFTLATGLQWTLVDPFMKEAFSTITTNIFASGVSIPTFLDIDNDGDMDILGYNSVPDGRIVYHRNLSKDLFGHCDSLKFEYASGCWGNFALRTGSTNTVGCFHCPCREAAPDSSRLNTEPVLFDASEAARRDDTISSVFALDLDGDGDKELLIGDISSENTLMIHNGGTPFAAEMDSQDTLFPSTNVSALFNGYHFHSYVDLDNDSKKDLLVMANEFENKHGIWWYKNTGTNSSPVLQFQGNGFLQDEMLEAGENAAPVLFDYDSDGLLDLVIGASVYQGAGIPNKNSLYLYRNTGTSQRPQFDFVTDDFASISQLAYASPLYPAFGDLDNDGDQDMVLGIETGTLQFFNNSAGSGNPASFQLALPNYMGIDIGNSATPQLFDLNKDGKLDLIIGEKNGFINYFENGGSVSSAFFPSVPTNDTLGCIVRQLTGSPDGFTVPFVYDTLGKTRLLVSNLSGNIFQYKNIDGNLNGCFTFTDSVFPLSESSRIKLNLTVSGGDLNGDGLTDLVVGQSSGGVQVYMQRDPSLSVSSLSIKLPVLDCYPNPAQDRFTVQVSHFNPSSASRLILFDSMGNELLNEPISGISKEISTENFAPGIYLIQLSNGAVSLSRKIMVIH